MMCARALPLLCDLDSHRPTVRAPCLSCCQKFHPSFPAGCRKYADLLAVASSSTIYRSAAEATLLSPGDIADEASIRVQNERDARLSIREGCSSRKRKRSETDIRRDIRRFFRQCKGTRTLNTTDPSSQQLYSLYLDWRAHHSSLPRPATQVECSWYFRRMNDMVPVGYTIVGCHCDGCCAQ
jgi:hypothetical protein